MSNTKESFSLDQSDYHEQEPAGNFVKPLSTKFYNNLLRLEEKVQRKKFTLDTINEIIPLYHKTSIFQSIVSPFSLFQLFSQSIFA